MSLALSISPHGRPFIETVEDEQSAPGARALNNAASARIAAAFAESASRGLLDLATVELQTPLPAPLDFARDVARAYLTKLCHSSGAQTTAELAPIPPPPAEELAALALQAPPMRGLEYLSADQLAQWWTDLDSLVREEIRAFPGGAATYLQERNPLWRLVGRVTFHLAENKRDPQRPFAFLATYATRLSAQGRVQQQPLGRALEEFGGAQNRPALLSLLTPIQRATESSTLAKELVDSGDVYHPLAWTPREAYRFLQDIPAFEQSGLIVRVPDWWKANHPPRPTVSVKIGDRAKNKLGVDALLDFSVAMTLDGQPLSEQEMEAILASSGGLVALKGKWIEVDRDKLAEALRHWKQVERSAKHGELSFFEGMRLLAGAPLEGDTAAAAPEAAREWTGITCGEALEETLRHLRDPATLGDAAPPELRAQLRPYQQVGVNWLRFMSRLGLGACLADDMGLGKTIQVIALLLHLRRDRGAAADAAAAAPPSLLVVPASLIANWKSEIARFGPSLSLLIAHPSEQMPSAQEAPTAMSGRDLVITTYGMIPRLPWMSERSFELVILDEAQAIKNSGTRQTRAVKSLRGNARIALTGTPVENRLSDLWSLFDFLNPGLLGSAKAFSNFVKQLNAHEHNSYAPLRSLAKPYILRRLKTDKRIIADLPEKTEVNAFCTLSKRQAALYEQSVRELAAMLKQAEGIQRRGVVLAYLMRLKQICNHPAQLAGGGESYAPEDSGKFQRLRELCEELAERQEKALIFTQFREISVPLADFLANVFGRPGLVLHGGTTIPKRREFVEAFQRSGGPPFFVLSLKAGGTGLNLTEASHVIHFDRWWNPAVENQATDRAFRIGQKRNVFVHKFVCRGTVEDKIDELITQKSGLARELLDDSAGGETMLTEMSNDELLRFVALDVKRAIDAP